MLQVNQKQIKGKHFHLLNILSKYMWCKLLSWRYAVDLIFDQERILYLLVSVHRAGTSRLLFVIGPNRSPHTAHGSLHMCMIGGCNWSMNTSGFIFHFLLYVDFSWTPIQPIYKQCVRSVFVCCWSERVHCGRFIGTPPSSPMMWDWVMNQPGL